MSTTVEEFDDEYDDGEEGGLSGFYILVIFLILLAAFIAIVFFAYQKGLAEGRADDGSLPVVAADPTPVREEVPLATSENPRREVYDRLEGNSPTIVVADADPARDPLEGFEQAPQAERSAPGAESEPEPAATPARTEPVRPAPEPEAEEVEIAAVEAAAEVEEEPAAVTPEPAPRPEPAAQQTGVTTGTHVVQVGAFGSDEEAMTFYDRLSGRLGSMVSGKTPDIQTAVVNGRNYHRLRLGPFDSKSAAQSYCNDLKGQGQDCLVRSL
ncbi:SPOR domain-containing protein [Parvularcula oceani]|uniref:SPOR domain-containing protein n=1 Tax=Parvularcula oceani TaxID=1247963 RepID=UPI000AD9B621|nr:SPOR domain-containing protein [Parvularcula oceani]